MKKILVVICCLVVMLWALQAVPSWAGGGRSGVSPAEAMEKLKEGNDRFADGKPVHPNQTLLRRQVTAEHGQHPFAVVLSCSDSRGPVEITFDQGVGDIFVVRVAGNVANVNETGSIEYALDHLGVPLLVVLGHTHCGAVTAAAHNAEVHDNVVALVKIIAPAVAKAKAGNPGSSGDALVNDAILANVWESVENIYKASPTIVSLVKDKKAMVVGAIHDIESGKVTWKGPHPDQAKLLEQYGTAKADKH